MANRLKTLILTRHAQSGESAPDARFSQPHYVRTYTKHMNELLESWGSREGALQAAVGSVTPEDYEAVGRVEKAVLLYAGLRPDDFLLDVGCGSGRLAVQLSEWLKGPYLGTDVVPALLDHATRVCGRKDWRFEKVASLTVPAASDSVDMACAFSVFTHLRHEESYVYMQDIYRVLKPGGRLVFSYLEFRVPGHWNVMEGNIESIGQDNVLNQFMSHDLVEAFAQHLGFQLIECHSGDDPFIPRVDPLPDDDADPSGISALGGAGQSVAIYSKPR